MTHSPATRTYKVHNHGFVRLVDYMGNDKAIEQAARVSHGGAKVDERTPQETKKLIRHMMREEHTSPFEMVEVKFHCKMPIFVARQWIRHRTASVNEISGRYSVLNTEFFRPTDDEIREQSKTNKQGSGDKLDPDTIGIINEMLVASGEAGALLYESLLEVGLSKELARIDLPLSTYTEWYWKVNLHNLFRFLKLRVDLHAQSQIRAYADVMAGIVWELFPESFEAWLDYVFYAVKFSRQERDLLYTLLYRHLEYNEEEDLHAVLRSSQHVINDMVPREVDEFKAKLRNLLPNTREAKRFDLSGKETVDV